VPLLTENSLKLLKSFCLDPERYYISMNTLKDLIMTRLTQRDTLLNLLLSLTHNPDSTIRANAILIVLKFHLLDEYRKLIEVNKQSKFF
jgi:hypothetical protein